MFKGTSSSIRVYISWLSLHNKVVQAEQLHLKSENLFMRGILGPLFGLGSSGWFFWSLMGSLMLKLGGPLRSALCHPPAG